MILSSYFSFCVHHVLFINISHGQTTSSSTILPQINLELIQKYNYHKIMTKKIHRWLLSTYVQISNRYSHKCVNITRDDECMPVYENIHCLLFLLHFISNYFNEPKISHRNDVWLEKMGQNPDHFLLWWA